MAAALAALFADPQNNLRLFVVGTPVQLPGIEQLQRGWQPLQRFGGLDGLIRLLCHILKTEGLGLSSL
jgi:hypothetical protein